MWVLMRTLQHAEGFVVFDEAHAAHVGGELEDDVGACGGLAAVVLVLQVEREVLDVVETWYHSSRGLMSTARMTSTPLASRSARDDRR